MKKICSFFLLICSFLIGSIEAISLPSETRSILKTALESRDAQLIDTLYTSIMMGNTVTFSDLITNTSGYLEQLAERYVHPTTIVTTIDNNATIRNLAMFDYFTDAMALKTMLDYLDTHRSKPFMPNFKLMECYKALLSVQLYTDSTEKEFTQDDLAKAVLAIIVHSRTYDFRNLLHTLTQEKEYSPDTFYAALLQLSVALEKPELIEELQAMITPHAIIKPTLKEMLTCAHTFFQQLYCK